MSPAVFTASGPPHRGKSKNENAFEVREECMEGDGGNNTKPASNEQLHNLHSSQNAKWAG